MLGQGQVEAQSLGWRQRRAQEPGFPSLSLLHLEAREPPGPRQEPLSASRMSPAAARRRDRSRGGSCQGRCFLVELGWTWAEPSPLAWC